MPEWHYAPAGSQGRQGPVSTAEIRMLIRSGRLQPGDRLWKEGLADWIPVRQAPEFSALFTGGADALGPPAPGHPRARPRSGTATLPPGLQGWMQFVAAVSIVVGVMTACVFGLGILLIVGGVALLGAKNELAVLPPQDPRTARFLTKLATFLKCAGWFYLGYIVLMTMYILVLFALFLSGALDGLGILPWAAHPAPGPP